MKAAEVKVYYPIDQFLFRVKQNYEGQLLMKLTIFQGGLQESTISLSKIVYFYQPMRNNLS